MSTSNPSYPLRQQCGRPTKTGKPCKREISPNGIACEIHITPHELELRSAMRNSYREGFSAGIEAGKSQANLYLECEVRRRVGDELAQRTCIHTRTKDFNGRQFVTVRFGGSNGYGYSWSGEEPLKIGDKVLVPPGRYQTGVQQGTVIRLGSDYDGVHTAIIKRIEQVSA